MAPAFEHPRERLAQRRHLVVAPHQSRRPQQPRREIVATDGLHARMV